MKSLKEKVKCVITAHTVQATNITMSTYFAASDRHFRTSHNMYWVERHTRLWIAGQFR